MAKVVVDPKQVRPLAGAVTRTAIAGATMKNGYVVRFSASNTVVSARANSHANCKGKLGIVVDGSRHNPNGDVISGETVTLVMLGPVFLGNSVDLDESKIHVLGNGEGDIDDAGGTVTRHLGYPQSNNILWFNDSNLAASS